MSRKRQQTTRRWAVRQQRDPFLRAAKEAGYRTRASYKLLELDRRDGLLKAGACVVELGAAPGGWTQVIAERVGGSGQVLAVDTLAVTPVDGAQYVQADIAQADLVGQLRGLLRRSTADLVLSDIAPNLSGIRMRDQAVMFELAELALGIACALLRHGGAFVVKVFHGEGFEEFRRYVGERFSVVEVRKPSASRADSRECYLVAKGFSDVAAG